MLPQGDPARGTTSYVARTVAYSYKRYYLHSIRCPDPRNGLHAVAYCTPKRMLKTRHVEMFDPDHGEYQVPVERFAEWLPRFLKRFYGTGEGDSVWQKEISRAAVKPECP